MKLRLKDGLEHAELADLLGLEAVRIVQDLAVAVAQDIGREPASNPEHTCAETGCDQGLHQGLTRLEVLAADGRARLTRQLQHGGRIRREVRRAVGVGDALLQAGPSVDL